MNKILIASVLKPVNDTRAFSKLGLSLRETNKYHLNIIGFFAKNAKNLQNIKLTALYDKARLHPKRLLVSKNFLKEIKEYQPDMVIVTTYELLPAAIWGKKRYNYKLIYDVQENYSLNVSDHQSYPLGAGKWLSKIISRLEAWAAPYVDHFILAEENYQYELPFLEGRFTVLQNKFQGAIKETNPFRLDHKNSFSFLISGTITPAYGVAEAVAWFKEFARFFPGSSLTVIGHVTMNSYHQELKKLTKDRQDIHLKISPFPVPHSSILVAYDQAEIILLPYRQKLSIKYKIPTKLFEALALGKPILHVPNSLWEAMVKKYPAGTSIDFTDHSNVLPLFHTFLDCTFYEDAPSSDLLWDSEKQKLITLVDNLLK